MVVAQEQRVVTVETPVRVQLDGMPTGALVTMLMRDVMKVPYVIAPDVLTDRDPVSVNLEMSARETPRKVFAFLKGIGLSVEVIDGTVYVSRKGFGSRAAGGSGMLLPGQLPPGGAQSVPGRGSVVPGHVPSLPHENLGVSLAAPLAERSVAMVVPGNRPVAEFVPLIQTLLPDVVVASRDSVAPVGSRIVGPLAPDALLVSGSPVDVDRALSVVTALDIPRQSVEVSAVVVEFNQSRAKGSALAVLANFFGGKVSGSSLASAPPSDQALTLAVGGLTAVFSAVNEDSRFSIIAEPRLTVSSGGSAVLTAGSDVPTLGAVSFGEGGQSVRSVEYRRSGTTLTVSPVVLPAGVSLDVAQERSSFAATTNGVNDSPTLNQTSFQTALMVQDGETVVVAGLDEATSTKGRKGVFGGLLGARSSSQASKQLLLFISVRVVDAPAYVEPVITRLGIDFVPSSGSDQLDGRNTAPAALNPPPRQLTPGEDARSAASGSERASTSAPGVAQ